MNHKSSPPQPIREDLSSFASMMEARLQSEEERGIHAPIDKIAIITKLYEDILDLKAAVNSGRDVTPRATGMALLAMRLVKSCGPLSASAARRDSMHLLDPKKDPLRDASVNYAIVHKNRCTLWGAVLDADFDITEQNLAVALPAIRTSMQSLHRHNLKAARILICNGQVNALPDDMVLDPRTIEEKTPILF